jgi:hypothetical protein
MIFVKIGDVIAKVTLHCVGQASLQMANMDISLFWIWRWSLFCLLSEVAIGWVIFWFPPNQGQGERHLAGTIYPSCEKPHTSSTIHIRGQSYSLVTQFVTNIKFKYFLMGGVKFRLWDLKVISPHT